MEFGKIQNTGNLEWTLGQVDWTVYELPEYSKQFLRQHATNKETKFFIGAPSWSHKEWVGSLYPDGIKSSEYLYHYARVFNCIELNTTHYRIPTSDQTKKWKEQVSSNFLFCPKMPQVLSHSIEGLLNRDIVKEWLMFLELMSDNLGPCFLQMPPHFDYSKKAILHEFIKQWPSDFQLSLELRHSSWYENRQVLPALTRYLQNRNIGLVITDTAGRRDIVHSSVSSRHVLLRFIGNSLHVSDYERSLEWIKSLTHWTRLGLREVFFFVHQPDAEFVPPLAEHVIAQFNTQAQAGLNPIQTYGSRLLIES